MKKSKGDRKLLYESLRKIFKLMKPDVKVFAKLFSKSGGGGEIRNF